MEEQKVLLETAILAKEKGFNWPTLYYHSTYNDKQSEDDSERGYSGSSIPAHNWNETPRNLKYHIKEVKLYSAPTQSFLQKWLRKVHKIDIFPYYKAVFKGNYLYNYTLVKRVNLCKESLVYNSYEEALEIALQEALKLINKQS